MPPARPAGGGSTRSTPRLLLALAAVLLLARVAAGVYEHAHPPQALDQVAWVDIDKADARARAGHTAVLYDFSADWCPPCRAMDREVFADRKAAATISSVFVPVRVIDRRREDGRNAAVVDSLQRRFRVESFPTLVVFSPETGRHESVSGYRGRKETLRLLQGAHARLVSPWKLKVGTSPAK
jgi:thiol:disulfide interchange protein